MRLCRALAFLLLLAPVSAAAQYSIDKVVFENASPYTDTELLSVSGLAAGQFLGHDSLTNAGQHLLDTGLFVDVQVSLSGQGKARTVHVELKPTPLSGLLPVSFENLVWFTPEELTQGIHARVPLYRGVAAEAGNLPEAIEAAIKEILAAKGVQAKLSYEVSVPSVKHPARVLDFRVEQPAIRLAHVHLSLEAPPGVAAQLTPGFQVAVNHANKSPFDEGLTGVTVEDLLLPAARNFGYITAHLDRIERTVAPGAGGLDVTYTTRVVTGEAYKISSFTWEPTPVYSAAEFARDALLHAGDVADVYALNETDTLIAAAYLAHGYMDVVILAPPVFDEASHTVAYVAKATPGEIYRVKSVTPLNLSPEARKEFDSGWHMNSGEPYNESYVAGFIQANKALQHLAKYTASYQASADPQTHLVELTINFLPAGR